MTVFMATLEGVMDEERVKKSDCGPNVLELISSIRESSPHNDTCDLVVKLCDLIHTCINAGIGASFPQPSLEKSGLHFMNFGSAKKYTRCGKHTYLQ